MDYPSPEMFVFSSWMRGKCWITIIRNQFSTNPFTRLGCSLLFWTARAVTVTLSVFCSIKHVFILISSGSEILQKEHKEWPFSAAIVATLAHQNRTIVFFRKVWFSVKRGECLITQNKLSTIYSSNTQQMHSKSLATTQNILPTSNTLANT